MQILGAIIVISFICLIGNSHARQDVPRSFKSIAETKLNGGFDTNSNVEMSIGLRNDYLLTSCGSKAMKRSFPNLEFALMGYDVLKGFPLAIGHDPGFTRPIFQANYSRSLQSADCRYSIPEGFFVISDLSCQTSMKSETIKSSEDLSKQMSVSAKVSGGGWGAEFSASAGYSSMERTVKSGETVVILSSATCQYYYTVLDEISPPPLHASFIDWVIRLNSRVTGSYSSDDIDEEYLQFINYYGTHFITTVTYGAKFVNEYKMSTSSYSKMSSSEVTAEVAASYSGFGISVGGSFSFSDKQSEAVSNFQSNVEKSTVAVGAPPPADGDTLTWASTVKDSPAPYTYSMKSIDELFRERYFKRYKDIKNLDVNKIRDRLIRVKSKYSTKLKDLLQRSFICSSYTKGITLENDLCLESQQPPAQMQNDPAVNSVDKCEQKCNAGDCLAMKFFQNNETSDCQIFYTNKPVNVTINPHCVSYLYPARVKTSVESLKEIPGKFRLYNFAQDSKGKSVRSNTVEECEEECTSQTECVASYFQQRQRTTRCYLMTEDDISTVDREKKWRFEHYIRGTNIVTFIRSCSYQ